jgi:pimeloyl-ACP methyl ester carboxylesterase
MAIIRFTCDGPILYAPTRDGALITEAYDAAKQIGRLGKFAGGADDSADGDLDAYLAAQLKSEARDLALNGAPLMLLVHGFMFNPKESPRQRPHPTNNPHSWIYHFDMGFTVMESWGHSTGWAGRLGFADTDTDHGFAGLPIAFGWFSAPAFSLDVFDLTKNFYSKACGLADNSALPFLALLGHLAKRLPNQIDIFAHSMGTQLTITALLTAPDALLRRLGRVVLVGGSAYSDAGAALATRLDALAAGAQVYNFVNQTDEVLKRLARHFGPKGDAAVLGFDGLDQSFASWMSLRLNDPALKDWAQHRKFPLAHDLRADMPDGDVGNLLLNHWAYYAHDGNMRFFADLFRARDQTSIAAMRADKIPEFVAKPGS